MRGKVKETCSVCVGISSTLREKMPKHHCCAYNCTNSEAKKKDPVRYPEVSNVSFHCFPSNDENKQYAPGMSEKERRRRWIAACRLESLNVTRHTRLCSQHFEGGLGPTKANPVPSIFDFPKHLQPKEVKQRQDPESRRLKNASTCTTTRMQKERKSGHDKSKVRKSLDFDILEPQEHHLEHDKSIIGEEIGNQDLFLVAPELHHNDTLIGDQHLLLEKSVHAFNVSPTNIKDDVLYHDQAVQTELTADQITRMEQSHFKLHEQRHELKRDLFLEDVQRNDSSVKFYTGLPSLSCLLMLFEFLKPIANCMKYWDGKNKTRAETYQVKL